MSYSANIISNVQVPSTSHICLEFWYQMIGENIVSLQANAHTANVTTLLWSRSAAVGYGWSHAQVSVINDNPYNISFVGTVNNGYTGIIAIDDVRVRLDSNCPSATTCDFEGSSCGWINTFDVTFFWIRTTASFVSAFGNGQTGPKYDHTLGTTTGHFMYFWSAISFLNEKARFQSPQYPATSGSCFSFWYHMLGREVGDLTVYVKINNVLMPPTWSRMGNRGDIWRFGQVTVNSSNAPFNIIIEGSVGNGFVGDMAIDDISLVSGACPSSNPCNFESQCTWINGVNQVTAKWVVIPANLGAAFNGPNADSDGAPGQGRYAIVNVTASNPNNLTARYISDEQDATQASCFSFYYQMYGDYPTLNIYLQELYTGTAVTKIIGQIQNNTNVWTMGQVFYTALAEYQIIIEAVAMAGTQATFTIDNLNFNFGNCSGPTLPAPSIPPVIPPTNNWGCSFSSGTCSWTALNTTAKWVRSRGSSSSNGPSTDHTTGTGS